MDNIILVLYIDVNTISDRTEIEKISKSLLPKDVIKKLNATVFIIPNSGGGTKIECINPKYILDKKLYDDYMVKLNVINDNVNKFILENKNGK